MNNQIENFATALQNNKRKTLIDPSGNVVQMPDPGQKIGSIRLTEIIGKGAMGIVYKGISVDLGIERAVKMPYNNSTPSDILRFQNEVRILAGLSHKNIVKVFSAGFYRSVLPYAEMELISGRTIEELHNTEKKFPVPFTLALMSIVCSALQYAYNQVITIDGKKNDKIVHRDIKPSNIMLCHDGTIKITDFGLARTESNGFTAERGAILGSIHYMAPEFQTHNYADVRSDIYSIGVTMYEMITGVKPFTFNSNREFDSLAERKLNAQYPSVRDHISGVPQEIIAIINKCLTPRPGNRYGAYSELRYYLDYQLENYTNISAEDLVTLYTCNRQTFDTTIKHNRKAHKKHFKITKQVITIFSLTLLTALSIFIFFFYKKSNKEIEPAVTENIKTEAPGDTSSDTVANVTIKNEQPAVKKETVRKKEIVVHNKKNELHSVDTRSKGTPEKKQQQENSRNIEVTPFKQAFDSMKKGAYEDAIGYFKKVDLLALKQKQKDSVIIFLMEACYARKHIQEMLTIADDHPVTDGKYYMLRALGRAPMGMHSEASADFEKMMTTVFTIDPISRKKGLFFRAKYYTMRYNKLQSSELLGKHQAAWHDFMAAYCPGNEFLCKEAEEMSGVR